MAKLDLSNPYRHIGEIHIDPAMVKLLQFTHLPGYARFLYDCKIPELAVEQYRISKEMNIPLLRQFTHLSEERLMEFGVKSLQKVLCALAENRAVDYIEQSLLSWNNPSFPEFSQNQISPEDISQISFIRCKLFRDTLPFYTKDQKLSILLMEEVHAFTSVQDTVSFRAILTMQQELYERAQQIAHIGNWSMDLASNALIWSKEVFRIYELDPRKSPQDLASFNHPDDAEQVKKEMQCSRETGQPHDFYYRIVFGDGREKYLHALGEVLKDASGRAEKMFGTLQDVTALKKMEREHREKEYFIQKITELTPSLIAVYQIKTGTYLYINRAIQTILGYRPEEVLEKGVEFFKSIIHPDDLPRILAENQTAIGDANRQDTSGSPEKIREFIYRMRHANGEWRWLHTFGAVFERDAENEVESVIIVAIDVTEQRMTEFKLRQNAEEIRKQEERYYKMIDEVEDYAILLLSTEGVIENWNNGAEKIKGYTSEEIIGKNFRIFYPAEDRENGLPERLIEQAVKKGKASHEGWRLRKDQSRFWGNIVITALHDSHGTVIGFSKVTRDLTQVKLAEDERRMYTHELELKNQELEQKNKELESFGYIASHDLQEPIRKIGTWANRIEETEDISDGVKDSLLRIRKASVRMQNLIQGVLQYSQIDMQLIPRELTDLDLVMEEVLNEFSESIEEKNIQIEKDHLPTLNLVRLQFVQLFSNIISNAVKYSNKELVPRIKITTTLEEEGEVSVDYKAFYTITIADNGIGFMQEHSDKMFELFRRLESGPGYSGMGIGLAICKKIVQSHRGTISANGEPGKGATFTIRLPVL